MECRLRCKLTDCWPLLLAALSYALKAFPKSSTAPRWGLRYESIHRALNPGSLRARPIREVRGGLYWGVDCWRVCHGQFPSFQLRSRNPGILHYRYRANLSTGKRTSSALSRMPWSDGGIHCSASKSNGHPLPVLCSRDAENPCAASIRLARRDVIVVLK